MAHANGELLTRTVLSLFRAHGSLIQWGDHFAAPFGLTSSRWQMLGALALAGEPLATPRVAAAMGVTRQGARKQLARLVADGLVEERRNPHHQRSPLYALTPEGESLYAEVEARWNAHAEALARKLDPRDLEAAQRILEQLTTEHAGDGGGAAS